MTSWEARQHFSYPLEIQMLNIFFFFLLTKFVLFVFILLVNVWELNIGVFKYKIAYAVHDSWKQGGTVA